MLHCRVARVVGNAADETRIQRAAILCCYIATSASRRAREFMSISFSSILATATDPLFLAGIVTVAGFFGARYWQGRSSLAHFLIQLLVFVILTGLLLAGGVIPYRPGVVTGAEYKRLFVGALEVIWWLGAAWLAVGFLRAF